MHRILTRSAAAAAGVLLPVIVAVFALACTAPHPGAQPDTNSQQAIGLSYGHHHNCRHDGMRSWPRSMKASACVLSAHFSFWFSGSQGTGRAHSHYGDLGASQSGKPGTHGTRPSGTQPSTPPAGTQPGTPPAGTQPSTPPAGTQPGTPPAGSLIGPIQVAPTANTPVSVGSTGSSGSVTQTPTAGSTGGSGTLTGPIQVAPTLNTPVSAAISGSGALTGPIQVAPTASAPVSAASSGS